ncbi:hypothetical protein Tco_0089169 [Tanacetum coccineum]
MSSIYDVTSTLTQTALDAFCQKYHIPDTIHPKLPGPNQNIRNSLAGKTGVYTRFFDFANFRIPLSRFLEYFRINLAQLFVIAAAKISHFDSLKTGITASFRLMRLFSPLSFLAPFQKFSEPFLYLVGLSRYYDLDDNVYPTFLTDAGDMDWFAFIHHAETTKVRIGERRIEKGQVPLLDSTVGRVIALAGEDDQAGPVV